MKAVLHHVIRVRGNFTTWRNGNKFTSGKLACSRSDRVIRREGVSLTAKKESPGTFVTCGDEKSKGLDDDNYFGSSSLHV